MSIKLKNKSENNTRVSQPGVCTFDIPAGGEFEVSDVIKKVKVPSSAGEIEVDDVISALTICQSAVKDYGKLGLEFEHEGRRYFYLSSEEVVNDFEEDVTPAKPIKVEQDLFGEKGEN